MAVAVAAADFNGDGNLDFVVGNVEGGVCVFLGSGDGTFGSRAEYATGAGPNDIFLGDFNGDGKIDIATADASGCDLQWRLGNGDGTFKAGEQMFTNCGSKVVGADLESNGKFDLVMAEPGNTISVWIGDGRGRFTYGYSLAVPGPPPKIVIGDFDGDGRPDLATANANGDTTVFLANPLGRFQDPLTFPAGDQSQSLVAADVNGDGHLDLVVANTGSGSITTLVQSTLRIAPASLYFGTQTR